WFSSPASSSVALLHMASRLVRSASRALPSWSSAHSSGRTNHLNTTRLTEESPSMTAAVLDHDSAHAAPAHHTSLGANNRKLAIWTFIGSEFLFFASLITTFVIYRDSHAKGPGPKDIFEVPLVTAGTAVLLFSSFFVVMALNGAQQGNRKKLLTWL